MFAHLTQGHAFLESPRWHAGQLWVSDLYAKRVLTVADSGRAVEVASVAGRPSGLGFGPDGTPLVVSMADARVLRVDSGELFADLTAHLAPPASEMHVDAEGRLYVSNQGFDMAAGERPAPGALVLVQPGGEARVVARDLAFPNGMAITADGTLLVAETTAARISAFARAADGSLGERRVWAGLPGCMPDGIALDADGGLWVADPAARHVLRVEEGGRVTDELETPSRAYGCALGGRDGRTLFVCIADTFRPGPALAARVSAVVTTRVAVPGVVG